MRTLLVVVERAHRGAVETQYADVFYVVREFLRKVGRLDVALRGSAVTAALDAPPPAPLRIGPTVLPGLPDAPASVRQLLKDGAGILVDRADLGALGIDEARLVPGVACVDTGAGALHWPDYDAVWFV